MKKVNKAQEGVSLTKKVETPKKSKSTYKSDDGNYKYKMKYRSSQEPTEENPTFRGKFTGRRTVKGLLSGAPKVGSSMKKGGKIAKKK
jgi:hypothetical protein